MRHEVGGKAASLAEMAGAGVPVPPGFAVTTSALRSCREAADLDPLVIALLDGLDTTDMAMVADRCGRIRQSIVTMPVAGTVEASIRTAYAELGERCGTTDLPVAVRSSATSEDSPDASFAGEHDTYLWIRGGDAVVDAVRRCWASLFTDRATCYRVEMGLPAVAAEMSVVVQQMVRPVSAGVAFTLNPENGDRSTIAIESAWGFGEAVVSGEVTPDGFLVDKVVRQVTRRAISRKLHEYRLTDAASVVKVALEEPRASAASLTDEQVLAVTDLACRVEVHYGCPQDIEWAIDPQRVEGSGVVLLQARPETVWSRVPPPPLSASDDFMSSIVATLMEPLHAEAATAP